MLAFYPKATPADDKASVVGLFLATNAFCSIFSQVCHASPTLSCKPGAQACEAGLAPGESNMALGSSESPLSASHPSHA